MDYHPKCDRSNGVHVSDDDAALILSRLTSRQVHDLYRRLYRERVEWRESAATVGRIGFWTWHADDGCVELSRSWFRLYGLLALKRDDEKPITWYLERIHPTDRDLVWKTMTQAMQRQTPRFTIRHRIILANGETCRVVKRGGVIVTSGHGANSLLGTDIHLSQQRDGS